MRARATSPKILVAIALVLAQIALVPNHAAAQIPGDVSANPRVAPSGTQVTVSGSGCSSLVRVTVTRYLFPGTPTIEVDTNVSPTGAGTWNTTFSMPSEPAYILAECGGSDSVPLVIAPNDISYPQNALVEVVGDTIAITRGSTIDPTEFAIFGQSGALLGSAQSSGASAVAVLPRSVGGQTALGLSVSVPVNTGLPDSFIPLVREYALPLAVDTSLDLNPRVGSAGSAVAATGTCAGTARLTVIGRTTGWDDIATTFVDVMPVPDSNHVWSATFALPPIPARVVLGCASPGASTFVQHTISADSGGDGNINIQPVANTATIRVPVSSSWFGPFEAFTATGEPLVATEVSGGIDIEVPDRPVRVVLFGNVDFGENAEALQVHSVQAWYFDVEAPLCNNQAATIDMSLNGGSGLGTAGVDVIVGTPGDDVIRGLGAGDTICGLGGNDVILGGDGADYIDGGDGDDRIWGNSGADQIFGGSGEDRIRGGDDADVLNGGTGRDVVLGEAGPDTILGGAGRDSLYGGTGNDVVSGGNDTDLVHGGLGDDQLSSGATGNDRIVGGDGDDLLDAGATTGSTRLIGGDGNDVIIGSGQLDRLWGGVGDDNMAGGGHNDIMRGGGGSDTMHGNDGRDILEGGDGDDLLYGDAGNADKLVGSNGIDVCDGGLGNFDFANATCETRLGIP